MDQLLMLAISSLCTVLVAVAGWLFTSTVRQITQLTAQIHLLSTQIASLDGRYHANHEWITRIQQQYDKLADRGYIERLGKD